LCVQTHPDGREWAPIASFGQVVWEDEEQRERTRFKRERKKEIKKERVREASA
jgi:hypothetical protein